MRHYQFSKYVEDALFGNENVRGKLSVSDIIIPGKKTIKHIPKISYTEGILEQYKTLPKGTKLKGTFFLSENMNDYEDAAKIAFLSIEQLGGKANQGYGVCELSIEGLVKRKEFKLEKPTLLISDISLNLIKSLKQDMKHVFSLTPYEFELLVERLLNEFGYKTERTPKTRDGGYDIIAIKTNELSGKDTYLIECKRYKSENKIGIDLIRNIYSVVDINQATKGMIMTSSTFSKDAKDFAMNKLNNRIILHDYFKLEEWIKTKNFR